MTLLVFLKQDTSHKMPDILLVGNPLAKNEAIKSKQIELSSQFEKVLFEQLDRVEFLSLSTLSPNISQIQTGVIDPAAYVHSMETLAKFAKSLATAGKLCLTEPVLVDSAALIQLKNIANTSQSLPTRTERSIMADLVMNGFVNIQVVKKTEVSAEELSNWIENAWCVDGRKEQDAILQALVGKVFLLSITCQKPNYAVGSGAKLSFGKKKLNTEPPVVSPAPVQKKEAVWTVSALDDEVELEDEDALLDEFDLVVPATAAPGDCSTRKKACKDCSCGRAEEEEKELVASITVVEKKRTPVSSCGSCYLGDAFRCSSCPYLGMPAFKPGEKVQIAGNLLNDDL